MVGGAAAPGGAFPLRVVFFGTPEFAVPTLEALLGSKHSVAGVVTQPDRPRGRGQKTTEGPVKTLATASGIPVVQPLTLKDPAFLPAVQSMHADIGVVAAYGKILSEAVLAVPRLGMINVHASLLPRYRGAAPIHRAVIAGERETGVTIMRVVKALDAGPMLAAVARPIGEDETSADVERDLARLGAELLVATLDRLSSAGLEEIAQDDSLATYANRLTKEDGRIDWSRSARDIHNQIRGLHPWPHAHAFLGGERVILLRSRPVESHTSGAPGSVVAARGDELVVAAGTGAVALLELQREGKRAASAREFLAGRPVAIGERFTAEP
jgi:methionyl-tRNA formyltransferase